MTLNDTPSGERIHISFFGLRNAGKSSLVNAFLGQNLCIVSPVRGTTTDPVSKAMELLPLGPVLVTDTPGVDDEGELGSLRQKKAFDAAAGTDVAVLVTDARAELSPLERLLLEQFKKSGVPCIRARSKADLLEDCPRDDVDAEIPEIWTSAVKGWGVRTLKEAIAGLKQPQKEAPGLVDGIAQPGDTALLIVPVDSAAPKGRLILPQQQVIRDLLDIGARALVVKEDGIGEALACLGTPPACAVTDSQVFAKAAQAVPESVPLTSFSILMARRKGFLEEAVRGVASVASLKDGDTVLIAEGCTHHRQCGDIGTVKIPRWLRQSTGKRLQFKTVSGREFPEDCTPYALVVCCGGCMLSAREVASRIRCATRSGVPATNFGVLIASMQGVLARSLSVFPHLARLLASPQTEPRQAQDEPDAAGATGEAGAPDAGRQGFPASRAIRVERGPEQPLAKALGLVWEAFLHAGDNLPPQEAEAIASARKTLLARLGLAEQPAGAGAAERLGGAMEALADAEPGVRCLALAAAASGLARDIAREADAVQSRLERREAEACGAPAQAFGPLAGALAESLAAVKARFAAGLADLAIVKFSGADPQSAGLYARMAEDLRTRAGIRCARAGGTISAAGVCAGIGEAGMRTKALAVWLLSAIDAIRLRDADSLARDRRALRLAEIWASAAKSREAELSEIASRGFADPGRVLALAAEPLLSALELALRAFRLFGGCGFWDASGGKNAGSGKDGAHA